MRIKNDRKLELNKIKSQMYGEIEEIQLRNTSLENANEDYRNKLSHGINEIRQSEIVKQSLLDQILILNNQLMAKDNEMKETVSHYETMVNNMLNSN